MSNGNGRAKHGDSQDVITQEELANFKLIKEAKTTYDEYRRDILDRLDLGATVEPGPLGVEIKVSMQRRLCATSLKAILGEDGVEELKRQVVPSATRQLILLEV